MLAARGYFAGGLLCPQTSLSDRHVRVNGSIQGSFVEESASMGAPDAPHDVEGDAMPSLTGYMRLDVGTRIGFVYLLSSASVLVGRRCDRGASRPTQAGRD
jgi:hypothetical protein